MFQTFFLVWFLRNADKNRHGHSPNRLYVVLEKLIVARLVKIFSPFIGRKGALQYLKQPIIEPYPDLHESIQHPHAVFLYETFNIN